MIYMGSKGRLAKHLLPIILKNRKPEQWYIEPFVGGGNMIANVDGRRVGYDANPLAIKALEFIRDEELPTNNSEFTESDYRYCQQAVRAGATPTGMVAYALFSFSFGGKFAGGWARDENNRDYVAQQYRANSKQKNLLQGVELEVAKYHELTPPINSIIYCDPPYAKTTGYKDAINHDDFWEWCREKTAEGHKVFISEYNAPDDFVCLWEKEQRVVMSNTGNSKNLKSVERLFIHESQAGEYK